MEVPKEEVRRVLEPNIVEVRGTTPKEEEEKNSQEFGNNFSSTHSQYVSIINIFFETYLPYSPNFELSVGELPEGMEFANNVNR